jgi:hypothetical protein
MAAGAGLVQYACRENRITPDLLPRLTVEVSRSPASPGDRRLPGAIAALAPASTAESGPSAPKSVAGQESERDNTVLPPGG